MENQMTPLEQKVEKIRWGLVIAFVLIVILALSTLKMGKDLSK